MCWWEWLVNVVWFALEIISGSETDLEKAIPKLGPLDCCNTAPLFITRAPETMPSSSPKIMVSQQYIHNMMGLPHIQVGSLSLSIQI